MVSVNLKHFQLSSKVIQSSPDTNFPFSPNLTGLFVQFFHINDSPFPGYLLLLDVLCAHQRNSSERQTSIAQQSSVD